MSATFEMARLLKKAGASADATDRLLFVSRLHGARLENCRKNTGKACFAFNSFQLQMLPNVYRPPSVTTNSHVVS